MEELLIKNGDYVKNGAGGFEKLSDENAVLERVLYKLTARRGTFPLLPEIGSNLYLLGRLPRKEQQSAAEQYVVQALSDESNLEVTQVLLEGEQEERRLTVFMNYAGEQLSVSMTIQ